MEHALNGRLTIPAIFSEIGLFSDGLAAVSTEFHDSWYSLRLFGFVDGSGDWAMPVIPAYYRADFNTGTRPQFINGFAYARDSRTGGYVVLKNPVSQAITRNSISVRESIITSAERNEDAVARLLVANGQFNFSYPFGGVLGLATERNGHTGIDIFPQGGGSFFQPDAVITWPILEPGRVIALMNGFGENVVAEVSVAGRNYILVFAHMNPTPNVTQGQILSFGTELGIVGNTGYTTTYHLHFEVREGSRRDWATAPIIDPIDFLLNIAR